MARQAGVDRAAPATPRRGPGELRRNCLDPGRAAIHLGWKPWTTLAEGTGGVLDYFRERRARGSS